MAGDMLEMPDPLKNHIFLGDFRADPVAHPRPTASGRLCLLYTSPSPRDRQKSRMPSSA